MAPRGKQLPPSLNDERGLAPETVSKPLLKCLPISCRVHVCHNSNRTVTKTMVEGMMEGSCLAPRHQGEGEQEADKRSPSEAHPQ